MKPILLKGHTRALTYVKYNKDGDLLFSCSKDNKPTLWTSDTGERVGTYDGHNGTIWDMDIIDADIPLLLTGSADGNTNIWKLETGELEIEGEPVFVDNGDGTITVKMVIKPR